MCIEKVRVGGNLQIIALFCVPMSVPWKKAAPTCLMSFVQTNCCKRVSHSHRVCRTFTAVALLNKVLSSSPFIFASLQEFSMSASFEHTSIDSSAIEGSTSISINFGMVVVTLASLGGKVCLPVLRNKMETAHLLHQVHSYICWEYSRRRIQHKRKASCMDWERNVISLRLKQ